MAELTDLSDTPLVNDAGSTVKPNMMFILDNSGSMDFNYMPDYVANSFKCRVHFRNDDDDDNDQSTRCGGINDDTDASGGNAPTIGGDPPSYSHLVNTVYYNPSISYTPPVSPCNTAQNLPSMTDWTKVRIRGHLIDDSCVQTSSTINLVSNYPEHIYCKKGVDDDDFDDSTQCKRNGIHDGNYAGDYDWPDNGEGVSGTPAINWYDELGSSGSNRNPRRGTYPFARTMASNPHYYLINPTEHCTNATLSECSLSTTPTGQNPVPAYVRFCQTSTLASSTAAVTGTSNGSPRCQAKFDTAHQFARYGNFDRLDIIASDNSYPKAVSRTDCAGATCTYAEEMTNFANWYAYYRTRMQSMKTAAGRSFSEIDNSFRVGYVTINPAADWWKSDPVVSAQYLPIKEFDTAQKQAWYKKFYANDPQGSTPLREALSRVGRHFAGVTSGINDGMTGDPVQFECQQNFALLTTDGYWNGNAGQKINGDAIGNQDNQNSGYSTRAVGAYDGGNLGTKNSPEYASDTLADVAMYYYKTDLRSSLANKVPTSDKDTAEHQHMVTFTLGLGLDGELNYRPDYETATTGDFAAIKNNQKNWPNPEQNDPTALDDLWHAAVNGRGLYFSAKDPVSLAEGVKGALGSATVKIGAAAASATSSPNITPSDNFIYSSTYRTVFWDGEVVAKTIDTQTGEVSDSTIWSAQANLDALGTGRTIYKMDTPVSGTPARETFEWSSLTDAEKIYFNSKCSLLSQCAALDETTKAVANSGEQLLAFLRGDSTHENPGTTPVANKAFRDREHTLGDTVNATPAFVKAPRFNFSDDGYANFKLNQKNRQGMLYVAANDGMLHAFNATTGAETWAYVPHIVMKDMYQLADKNYGAKHQYFVDGSPQVMDIKSGGTWKTILVGGMNGGGRGYYALDVTNPASPSVLWEFCYDSTYCNVSDDDLGFTYGNPVIAKMPAGSTHAGQWVVMVTSGYNNVSPGDGKGYLYILNAASGEVLQKVSTEVGTGYVDEDNPGDPSGLAKISAWADNADIDATATHVYGGDLKGNLWRFDLKTPTVSVSKMAELAVGGVVQPITTKPELGLVKGITDRIVFVGTGKYLGGSDLTDTATQSIYAIRDTGSEIDPRALTPRIITKDGITATVSGDAMNWASGGWYADFSAKERVNIDPQLALGTLLVATSTPEGSTCSPGGYSWIYQFDYNTGLTVLSASSLGQKKSSGLVVGIVVFRLPNGQLKAVATTGDGSQDTFGVNVSGGSAGSRRTGWRELTQ